MNYNYDDKCRTKAPRKRILTSVDSRMRQRQIGTMAMKARPLNLHGEERGRGRGRHNCKSTMDTKTNQDNCASARSAPRETSQGRQINQPQ
eukprot:scaffold164503_cov34-Tisochrysis_lutea.AAC.1